MLLPTACRSVALFLHAQRQILLCGEKGFFRGQIPLAFDVLDDHALLQGQEVPERPAVPVHHDDPHVVRCQ